MKLMEIYGVIEVVFSQVVGVLGSYIVLDSIQQFLGLKRNIVFGFSLECVLLDEFYKFCFVLRVIKYFYLFYEKRVVF